VQHVGGDGITMGEAAAAQELSIQDNQLLQIGGPREVRTETIGAIVLRDVVDAQVLGNQIRVVAADAPRALGRAGVLVVGAANLRIGSNSILDVGADEFAGIGVGVLAGGVLERVDVHDNTVRRSTRALEFEGPGSRWTAIGVVGSGAPRTDAPIGEHDAEHVRALFEVLDRAAGPVVADGQAATYMVHAAAARIGVIVGDRGSVGVRGNVADAAGRGGGIIVSAQACVLAENRVTFDCRQENLAAVLLHARSAAISANHVMVRNGLGIRITAGPCTVLGNVVTGAIELNNAPLGPPWLVLNA
jgi:hypothetical protein